MKLDALTPATIKQLGLADARITCARGTLTLTFRFLDGYEEIWTEAPPKYPVDGSREFCEVYGVVYVPPPIGRAS